MIFSNARYETAAPAVIAALDAIQDRFSPEHDNTLEALSVMNSVRDAAAFGRPLVRAGEIRYVASTGIGIAALPTLAAARAFVAAPEHRFPRGRAIVEVDDRGAEPLYTLHALEGALAGSAA